MKHLKLFEEMSPLKDFPWDGHDLSPRERKKLMKIREKEFGYDAHGISPREKKILTDLVGEEHLSQFTIKVEDHYYYTRYHGLFFYYNRFDGFSELKDYILYRSYILSNKPKELLELLKISKLDPSFDENRILLWAHAIRYVEIVKLLLNDKRVRSKLSKEQFNKYTNEIS